MRSLPRTASIAWRTARGLTLIELLVVIVIIAILATIAFPLYTEQVRSSRRADCASVLLQVANTMERHFTLNNTYVGAPAPNQCPSDGNPLGTYAVVVAAVDANSFTLRANPINAQAGDRCGSLTLTHTGVKGIADANAGVLWDRCW